MLGNISQFVELFVSKKKVALCELQKCKRWRKCYFYFLNTFSIIFMSVSLCTSSSISSFRHYLCIFGQIYLHLCPVPSCILRYAEKKTLTPNCLLHHGQWCSRECVSRPLEPPTELSSVWSKSPNLSLSDRLHCISLAHTQTHTHMHTGSHLPMSGLHAALFSIFLQQPWRLPSYRLIKLFMQLNRDICFSVQLVYMFIFSFLVCFRGIKCGGGMKCY